MKKKASLKGRVVIHNILQCPVVEFPYRGGTTTRTLIASPARSITAQLVGKEIRFTLDGDAFGPTFHSEMGYAVLDPRSFKLD